MIGGARRETSWFAIGFDVESNTGGQATLASSLNAAALARRPFTIIRTHVYLHMVTDSIALEKQAAAVGFAVVSAQASATGVTAVPTPVTDLASDLFFVHQVMIAKTVFSTTAAFQSPGGLGIQVDSKAMRKVNDDQDLVITVEGAGADGFTIDIMGRFLIKEH